MRKYTLGMGAMLLALMLGPPGKLSAGTTVSMELTGVSNSLGGYYVAPYQFSVNGQTSNLICDDAQDDISLGETWKATTETFSNLNGVHFSQGYLDNGSTTISQQRAYEEAGWLVSQIFAHINNATVAGEYQYALWDLFTPGFSNSPGAGVSGDPNITPDLQAAELSSNYDSAAALAYDQNLVIYTPVSGSQVPQGDGQPQEFFGYETPQAPEPMTLWSLLVVLVAVALAYKWVGKTTVESTAAGM